LRAHLADSLEYIGAEIAEPLGIDPDSVARLVQTIRGRQQSPHVFGAYFELVLAIENDDFEEARHLFEELLGHSPAEKLTIAPIGDRPPAESDRYRHMFLDDPALAAVPDPQLWSECRARIYSAFRLLDAGFPEMAAEIRELLREIVVAAGPEDPKALTFDGASHFMLWGAILLNARGQKTVLDTAQALAHESGHNLLFGYCATQPLVENDDDELFASPLRIDPRPMDGIVHATYVIARMHQTLTRLLAAGVLDEDQTAAAKADLTAHERNFAAGDGVIREGGRLTEVGRGVLSGARDYMASATA
jgi:hypothetical protein